MSWTMITVAACLFAADPTDSDSDEGPEFFVPKVELREYKVHVKKGGRWTVRCEMIIDLSKIGEQEAEEIVKEIQDNPAEAAKLTEQVLLTHSFEELGEKRWQFLMQAKSNDMLQLSSLLRDVTGRDKCTFLWDKQRFELQGTTAKMSSSMSFPRTSGNGLGQWIGGFVIGAVLNVAMNEAMTEMKKSIQEAPEGASPFGRLILTTEGKITAGKPAQITPDGKTMTLDLGRCHLNEEVSEWSIRIDDL